MSTKIDFPNLDRALERLKLSTKKPKQDHGFEHDDEYLLKLSASNEKKTRNQYENLSFKHKDSP